MRDGGEGVDGIDGLEGLDGLEGARRLARWKGRMVGRMDGLC